MTLSNDILLISNCGNIEGHKPYFQNKLEYVDIAIQYGYHCKVDVWFKDDKFWLGHDTPRYEVNEAYLELESIWCQAKSFETLDRLLENSNIHTFWMEGDSYILTTRGYLIANEFSYTSEKTILVSYDDIPNEIPKVKGILSNRVNDIRKKITGQDQRSFNFNDVRNIDNILPDSFLKQFEK